MNSYSNGTGNSIGPVAIDVAKIKEIDAGRDLRQRGGASSADGHLPGTIHPFTQNRGFLKGLYKEISMLLSDRKAKKLLVAMTVNILCTTLLLVWSHTTDSMALTAYTYMTMFDFMSLLTCLVSMWVQSKKPTQVYTFGYERFEVLAVFSATILTQLGALFILKESVERMVQQPEVHTGRLMLGTGLAFVVHMVIVYGVNNKAFNHVVEASSSSWLQEHMTDMSESICRIIPGLSKLLLPRINPFALIAFAGSAALVITYILIDTNNYFAADTFAAVWIALMICGTMFPMSAYTGKILLQTTPSHVIGSLDKCLREASTLDGVLEFRHEHFWTLGFGSLAGSVHVRIRRDADEQLVLAHVVNRLSNHVSNLTVQIFKDDWTRISSSFQILGNNALMSNFSTPGNSPVRLPSSMADGVSKTPVYKPSTNFTSPLTNSTLPVGSNQSLLYQPNLPGATQNNSSAYNSTLRTSYTGSSSLPNVAPQNVNVSNPMYQTLNKSEIGKYLGAVSQSTPPASNQRLASYSTSYIPR